MGVCIHPAPAAQTVLYRVPKLWLDPAVMRDQQTCDTCSVGHAMMLHKLDWMTIDAYPGNEG